MAISIPAKNRRTTQLRKADETEAASKRFLRRKSWFITEMMRQQANRYQMALDEAYYDGDQWSPEEGAIVRARGQNPVVFNECKPMADFLIGTERRARVDYQVMNRTDGTDEAYKDAQNKTALLKMIDDINRSAFERSEAASQTFKAGLGWLEVGVHSHPTEYPVYKRWESWRNMLHDSLGQSKLPRDWRYIFRFREVDFDIVEAMVPRDKVDLLQKAIINADTRAYMEWWNGAPLTGTSSVVDAGLTGKWTTYDADAWLNNPRQRIMLIECWSTEVYQDQGDAVGGMHDRPFQMRKRCAVMTEYDTLFESWSPYSHDQFPFIPFWCYRRTKDGQPYGVIRQHRGPQDSLNKHMSKAQFRASTRQTWIESGALDRELMDEDEFEDAVNDPSATIYVAKGALSGKKIEVKEGTQLAQADIMLADRFAGSIRQNGPVSTEDRGQENTGGAVSGKARAIRQEQGSMMVAEVFDNLLLGRQLEGEITLSLAEQYHDQPLSFPAPGNTRRRQFLEINKVDPATGQKTNDIQARKAQFIIGESPWAQALAESAFESMMEMLGQVANVAPNVVVAILDIVFDLHPSLPKKDVLLRRIRQVTGMEDPDEGETPEAAAKKQQQEQIAQAQFEAQMAQLRADIGAAEAKGQHLNAQAMAKRLEALYMAAQAAQVLTMAPQIAPVADELARSVGFQDMNGDAAIGGPVPTVGAPPVPEAQQADGALAGGMAGSQSPEITGVIPQ
jgi:hypothetical protein